MTLSNPIKKVLGVLVAVLTVIALTLGAVRLALTPWFLAVEYRTPGFPADPSQPRGFTIEERLTYANIAVEYLLNSAGIEFLGDLRFPEGEQTPEPSCSYMDDCTRLFNERELKHMLDVKITVQGALRLWLIALIMLAVMGVWAWRAGWLPAYRAALARGGMLTLILLGAVIIFVLVVFGALFVFFHNIFFAPGTWMFFYTDTLIRLFPERFWRDTFLFVGGSAALMGFVLWRVFRK